MSMPAHILGPLEALERCLLLGPFHLGSLAQGALCPGGRASFGLSLWLCIRSSRCRSPPVQGAQSPRARRRSAHSPSSFPEEPDDLRLSGRLFPMPFGLENGMGEVAARTSFQQEWPSTFLSPTRNMRCSTPLFRLQTARRPVFCRRMQMDGHLSVFVPHSTQPCVRRL